MADTAKNVETCEIKINELINRVIKRDILCNNIEIYIYLT